MSVDKLFNIVSGVEYQLNILKDTLKDLDKEEQKKVDEAYQKGYKDCETRYCSFDACPNRQAEYQRGLDDAWECAKKLFSTMSDTEIEKVFPVEWESGFSGLVQMKPQYAMAKIKAYEQKQNDKIEVGDEVNWLGDCFIVTRIFQPHNMKEQCYGIGKDGRAFHVLAENVRKTGRHFDIAPILEDMRND